ncbi:MAG: hypothetical protein NTW29_12115 [Bacteroidetes bacterium]|nr:hypothetical protein [Bacteroidota bacterium]
MSAAKIRLSPSEMELLIHTEWILTKNRILEKTDALLGELLQAQQQYLQQQESLLPSLVWANGAKLSRGDNYRGLPYRVLDHPRCFSTEGYFAIRSIFWWGHFFSCTLLLSGTYQQQCIPGLARSFDTFQGAGIYYGVNSDPWHHHFEADNYLPMEEMDASAFEAENERRPFIKLAKKIPLQEWDHAVELLQATFELFIQATDQFPRR